jgi:hypothetical protein
VQKGTEVIKMQKLIFPLFVFTMLILQGCRQEEMNVDYNKVIGLSTENVSKMYVGYILPNEGFEYHTADKQQIEEAIKFLKKQQFSQLGKPKNKITAIAGIGNYYKLAFYDGKNIAPNINVVFFLSDEKVLVNDTQYRISDGSSEPIKQLFEKLKRAELTKKGKLENKP